MVAKDGTGDLRARLQTAKPSRSTSSSRPRLGVISALLPAFWRPVTGEAVASIQPPSRYKTAPPSDVYLEQVRQGFDRERVSRFLSEPARVVDVVARAGEIFSEVYPVWQAWNAGNISEEEKGEKLRDALGNLGPVFTKIGQTLAERPDLLTVEACEELRQLQTKNTPFSDELAYQTILEDLGHDGPLSPGGYVAPGASAPGKPLFQEFSGRVATASLGQVYKAKTWEGQEVAVKVQRANVAKQVVLDWQCIKSALELTNSFLKNSDDISLIADEAIRGIMEELDYHKEAQNALLFLERHKSQPWITAPTFLPEYTGPAGTARVLTMQWINGRRVGQIEDKTEQLGLVNMAVEACVSQLVNTGFVHVDPHEGNILLTDDGRIAFLDFGLMGHVPPFVMEGFAAGIQYTLAGDYLRLAEVMQDVDFIPKEGFQRVHGNALEPGTYSFSPTTKEDFASSLDAIMSEQDGGKSQFGAFFVGLLKMSNNFRLKTPPYIILFVRTFLTLEGIAAQYDPNFNIYEVGLPFAMRRALAPETESARKAFRDNFLTEDRRLKWETLQGLLAQDGDDKLTIACGAEAVSGGGSDAAFETPLQVDGQDCIVTFESDKEASSSPGFEDALKSLLGTPEGKTLRRVLADVDVPAFSRSFASSEGKLLRRQLSEALIPVLRNSPRYLRQAVSKAFRYGAQRRTDAAEPVELDLPEWHVRTVAVQRKQQQRWQRALRPIAGQHARRIRAKPVTVVFLAFAGARILLGSFGALAISPLRALLRKARMRKS
eukprot:TRINITY_DN76936_c0_g1_i1.p1 TRINITY_DN76936_c0_g1~~TRINITY_DN76936_c0_g1_i1.p1  ORF type:complete len:774 (+),score=148.52 TRINITY_DN76936_c0_g1_i1:45-2366(+)